jgi:hypothetical protein
MKSKITAMREQKTTATMFINGSHFNKAVNMIRADIEQKPLNKFSGLSYLGR